MFSYEALESQYIFTCEEVMYYGAPILFVSHVEDGNWLFLCKQNHDGDDAVCVLLKLIYGIDPSISKLADLPLGKQAKRASRSDPWEVF